MPNRSLLLISGKPEDQAFAAEVAITAGLSLQTVVDPKDGASIIAEEEPAVILCDVSTQRLYQAFETAIQESVGLFSDKINANSIYFLSSESLERVQYLVQSPMFGHFVIRNYGDNKET